MHWCEQWWLVITRPSGETKLPEHPPASRTEASRASCSHSASGENPYFWRTFFAGKLSSVHIPSSACAANAKARQNGTSRFIGRDLLETGRCFLCRTGARVKSSSRG